MTKTSPSSNSKDNEFRNAAARAQYLYLSTRGRKSNRPREIEIWFTYREPCFYVIAEYATSQWLQNLRADPTVQLRIAGKSFAACARIVSPEAEAVLNQAVQDLSREKYGWGDGLVVELIP